MKKKSQNKNKNNCNNKDKESNEDSKMKKVNKSGSKMLNKVWSRKYKTHRQ